MKRETVIVLLILFSLVLIPAAAAQEWSVYDWEISIDEARERAVEENKELMYFFAGSDWCSWCERLIGEVFSQELFRSFESSYVVPVLIDFPRQRAIPEELLERNFDLQEEFGVQAYPTVVILTPQGEEKFRTGYRQGGAGPYVNHLLPHVR
jgi:thioredoxin-related protein